VSGFIAIINTNNAPINGKILGKLTESLYFRGPDKQQVWIDGFAGLGHAQFKTTDEAQYESQPATLDGEVWITGCIRIDAREDLLRELGLRGEIRLAHTPDSHLVLRAYDAWGEKCPEHMLGDFSFAIWDRRKQQLFCARDRFGMRQLVYARQKDTFIVSNSIDCLRQHPLVSDRICDEAIGDFLLFGDHRWGSRAQTSFADIMALEPAHCFSLTANTKKTWRYWDMENNIPLLNYRKDSDYVEHFRDIFKASVSDRIRTKDVFISLSGGMDSSSIAATIRELTREGKLSVNLNAATVIYNSIHPSDEKRFADEVSDCLKLSKHHIDAGKYPLLSPPVPTTFPLELYQPQLWLDLNQYACTKSRVFLNGDGGDEILAFSSVRDALKDVNFLRTLVSIFYLKGYYGSYPPLGTGLKKIFHRTRGPTTPYPYPSWINPELEESLGLKSRWLESWSENPRNSSRRNPMIYESVLAPDWNTDDIYMNCGFTLPEQRSPFLDPRLVNFMASLPALPWLFKKHLLRRSMLGRLPGNILRRPKTPLGFIHDSLMKNAGYRHLNDWNSAKELAYYIDRSKLPVLSDTSAGGADSYINLRPLLLNQWLCELANRPNLTSKTSIANRLESRH
jgi:asparagine synthase (glutamine-hydrolysing)